MLLLLFVVLFVVSFAALIVVVKGNESLKAQHRAYVSSVNSVYDNHSNIIIGLQQQVEDILAQRADDQDVIANKDHHIANLAAEIDARQAVVEGAFDEAAAFRNKAESLHKELFEKKAELDNAMSNYKKELNTKERRLNDLIFRNEALELRVKEVCNTSDELYQALKEATK